MLPEPTPGSEPSWFGFPFAVRPGAPFTREQLVRHLETRQIGTRLMFGGNLVRQPAYQGLNYRVVSDLSGSDFVMRQVLWIGLYPGLTLPMLDYAAASIRELCLQPAHA
jgi:CDP-6-deoxy-D-xylo-4-hexulose-3-dehydrase